MPRYNPAVVEPKWQHYWEENRTFAAPRFPAGEKLYVLDMFPYPSGDGLHVGHPEGYTATDIVSRFNRMRGRSVMHPMGWDAFGLPAEQHAKKTGTHPRITTERNIRNFRRQLKMLGFSFDWDRELATTDPEYFRWTQFIFLLVFDTWFDPQEKRGRPIAELPIPPEVAAEGHDAVRRYQDEHRLAYQLDAPVNWCPALGTVLANEEVVGGVSERGGHPVVRLPMRQWMLRITAYADRLEEGLDALQWSESIKLLQRNWIGRSSGAEVDFFIGTETGDDGMPSQEQYEYFVVGRVEQGYARKPGQDVLRIYTTRPDTLYGATYMVIAPEHSLLRCLAKPAQAAAVEEYCRQAAAKSDLDRTDLAKEKTGVFTGSYAVNPVNGKAVPIWVADYVLASYGTGAIMAVPAHDTRDFEFAQQFGLPIVSVVDPGERIQDEKLRQEILAGRAAFIGDGTAIHSGRFDGLSTPEFKEKITDYLSNTGLGRAAVNYKLRDWLFSRQHFWGEPFPILHELDAQGKPTGLVRTVPAEELPVDLPPAMQFDAKHGTPEPPLAESEPASPASSSETNIRTPEPPLEKAPAEWLFVTRDGKRYKRETNTMPQWAGSCWYYLRFLDPKNCQAPVDPDVERAWMPVDLYVGGAEHAVLHLLYARFWHMVLHDRGYASTAEPFSKLVNQGMILGETGEKMSKSRGNVVNPDDVVREFGADSLRLFEMFLGPLEAVKPWSTDGVTGVRKFLDRVWRMIVDERAEELRLHPAVEECEPSAEQNRVLHKTIQAVTKDIEAMSFNTAIARMMEFTNYFLAAAVRPRSAMERLVLLLSPFAPHMAEELWQILGHDETLAYEPWPEYEEAYLHEETVEVPVQVNGKLRAVVHVPTGLGREDLESAARRQPRIAELLTDKTVRKVIVVPGRMVNFVVEG